MTLENSLERHGHFLFRWRSYLPLPLLAVCLIIGSATGYPLGSHQLDQWWELFCLFVGLIGVGIRCLVVGYAAANTSGRNAKGQRADALNTTGLYSLTRHPLYLGNYFMWCAVLLFTRSVSLFLVVSLLYWLYYERIIFTEERYLRARFGKSFDEWAARTPTFLPRLRGWQPPATPFQFRRVILNELASATALVLVLMLLEVASDARVEKNFTPDPLWVAIGSTSLLAYAVVRGWKWRIRRRTRRAH